MYIKVIPTCLHIFCYLKLLCGLGLTLPYLFGPSDLELESDCGNDPVSQCACI